MTKQIDPNLIFEAKNIILTGSNYIDTGFQAFSSENINRDFKITIRASELTYTVSTCVIIGCKYEGSVNGVSYPGFYYRFNGSNSASVQVSTAGNRSTNYNLSTVLNKNMYIWRTNTTTLHSMLEDGTDQTLTINSTTFDRNLLIGAGMQGNGTLFRYVKGTIDYIKIEYI